MTNDRQASELLCAIDERLNIDNDWLTEADIEAVLYLGSDFIWREISLGRFPEPVCSGMFLWRLSEIEKCQTLSATALHADLIAAIRQAVGTSR